MTDLQIFEKYFNEADLKGESFLDRMYIKSNNFYIFLMDNFTQERTFVMFSKKFYLTIELTHDKKLREDLDRFADIADQFRAERGLSVTKHEFWLPHCYVNGNLVDTQFIAEAYGVSRELALAYLVQYDTAFYEVYNENKHEYFGLPLFATREEADNYELKDNTKKYKKGLKVIEKYRR